MENLTPEQMKMYETFQPPDFNTPFAWAQAPRRMGADKNGDYVYVGNSFGGTLAKINIHTKETTLIPLPNPEAHQPYQIGVDKEHNVWTNLWSTDKIAKYNPSSGRVDAVRAADARHRVPSHLAARTQRPAAPGDYSVRASPESCRSDAAQRCGTQSAEDADQPLKSERTAPAPPGDRELVAPARSISSVLAAEAGCFRCQPAPLNEY